MCSNIQVEKAHITMQFQFDMHKTVEAIVYLINRTPMPTFMSIAKLLYFADKTSLEAYGRFITGDTYCAMQHGPVPSEAYNLMRAGLDTNHYGFEVVYDHHLRPLRDADLDELSEADIQCLDVVVAAYGKFPTWQLRGLSHDAAWEETWNEAEQSGRKSVPIPVERIANLLDNAEELVEYLGGSSD